MIKHENPRVQSVAEECADSIATLERLFKPGVKLTLLARSPDAPDGSRDMLVTGDELAMIANAIWQRMTPQECKQVTLLQLENAAREECKSDAGEGKGE